jgi:uncharacterized membrane protein YebE (DUF533 family)
MDAEQLIGTLIRGALGGRRKRSHGALRFLTGDRHSLLNAGTLLTAAGVAWGLYEAAAGQKASAPAPAGPVSAPIPPVPDVATPASALPPLPGATGDDASHVSPAGIADAPRSDAGGAATASPDVLRVIRLTIAAARADGALTPKEEDAILVHARRVGAESLVAQELHQPTPLAVLMAGAPAVQRDDLYTLAFAVARADEVVSGGERVFLAQLAHQLGLDPAAAAELERAAVERITAAAAAQGPGAALQPS